MPKIVHIGEFLTTWSLQSNSVTRQVTISRTKIGGKRQNRKIQKGQKLVENAKILKFKLDKNWSKMPKCPNSNTTFWVIFTQCVVTYALQRFFEEHSIRKWWPRKWCFRPQKEWPWWKQHHRHLRQWQTHLPTHWKNPEEYKKHHNHCMNIPFLRPENS